MMVVPPKLVVKDYLDSTGAPDGGEYESLGLNIRWQRGPLKPPGETEMMPPNGAFVETVIEAALRRLMFYQTTRFACQENADAIGHLLQARGAVEDRERRREAEGKLGTYKPD